METCPAEGKSTLQAERFALIQRFVVERIVGDMAATDTELKISRTTLATIQLTMDLGARVTVDMVAMEG